MRPSVYSVEPGATFCLRNVVRVTALKSGITAIRARPVARPLLDSDDDECRLPALKLPASPQTSLRTSHPSVSNLHFALQWLTRQVDHGPPEFVEHHPGGFVVSHGQLTLEEECGDPALIGGHQVCRPEPNRQRCFRIMQNCPGRQRNLMSTTGTLPASEFGQFISTPVPTARTHEAIRPAASG